MFERNDPNVSNAREKHEKQRQGHIIEERRLARKMQDLGERYMNENAECRLVRSWPCAKKPTSIPELKVFKYLVPERVIPEFAEGLNYMSKIAA